MNATSNIPYPSLQNHKPDEKHSQIIDQIICTCNKKMTTIATYLHQHWMLYPEYANISRFIFKISKVEMHHLDISGKLIILLGGNPELMINAHIPGMNKGSCNIHQILAENIESEMAFAHLYRRLADLTEDQYVSSMLNSFAMDEMLHAKLFTSYQARLPFVNGN